MGPAPLPRVVPVVRRRVRDGAHRRGGRRRPRRRPPPAWVHGTAMRSEPSTFPGRDPVRPAGRGRTARPTSTRRPASPTRASEIDCAEIYVPFSWYEPMWLENLGFAEPRARAGRWSRAAPPRSTATFPVNMSGGVLSSNPIGASGHAPLRRGRAAGARAWPASTRSTAPSVALGHAYGGGCAVLRHVGRGELASIPSRTDLLRDATRESGPRRRRRSRNCTSRSMAKRVAIHNR